MGGAAHLAVAADLLAAGAHAEAITLLIDAGLDVEAADALAEHAEPIAAAGRWVAVRRWIADLPPRLVRARHKLLVLQARAHMQAGEISRTLPLLDRAVEACVAAGDRRPRPRRWPRAPAGSTSAGASTRRWPTAGGRARLLAGQQHPALATAGRVEGIVAASQGDWSAASAPWRPRSASPSAAATAPRSRCASGRSAGSTRPTASPARRRPTTPARPRIWDELDDLDQAVEIRVSLGHVYLEQGADELARRTFEEARAVAERIGHQRMLSYALSNLGALDRDAGDARRGRRAASRPRWRSPGRRTTTS